MHTVHVLAVIVTASAGCGVRFEGGGSAGGATLSTTASSGGSGAGGHPAPNGGGNGIEVAGELLVDLDALQDSAGTATWQNKGSLGDFAAWDVPQIGNYMGVQAVLFDGSNDAYEGPVAPATLVGNDDRSIEVWVCIPSLGDEETLVSWGERDGTQTRSRRTVCL